MTDRKILLLGASGQIGAELCRSLAPLGSVIACSRGDERSPIDLAGLETLAARVSAHRPQLIVNAAAYTDVDGAESEAELAHDINARAVGVLGECAARLAAPIIHFSTDYVFDGAARTPYREDAPTAPLNVYGRSKRAGEDALLTGDSACLVLRTSWVYGLRGRNFLRTVLRLAREQPKLRIVDDQRGSPTWARTVADVTALLVAKLGFREAAYAPYRGLYHLTNAGETSWHGFAREILARLPDGVLDTRPRLEAISTADFATRATRPAYSVLDNRKLADTFDLATPPWELALAACVRDLVRL